MPTSLCPSPESGIGESVNGLGRPIPNCRRHQEHSAFQMKLGEICGQTRREGGGGTCEPAILPADGIDFPRGTRITLGEIGRRQTLRAAKTLKKRGARRFSSIGWTRGEQNDIIVLCSNETFSGFRGGGAGGLHHAVGEP